MEQQTDATVKLDEYQHQLLHVIICEENWGPTRLASNESALVLI